MKKDPTQWSVTGLALRNWNVRPGRQVVFRLLALAGIPAGALLSPHAAAYTCSYKLGASINLPIATSYTQSRDLPNGTVLTDWTTVESGEWYTCTVTNGYITYGYYPVKTLEEVGTTYDGSAVLKTNVPGLGLALRTRTMRGGAVQGGWTNAYLMRKLTVTGTTTTSFGGEFQIAVVKYGPMGSGKIDSFQLAAFRIGGDTDEWYGKGGYDRKYMVPTVTATARTCKTPDISVNLGEHSTSALPNVGSRTTLKKFTMQINECSAGMASVYYGFNFSGTTGYSGADGLFGLNSTATAKGIKVRLLNGDGTAVVQLDKWYTLSAYNKTVGGNYTVALSAAYERVGDVVAGTADAELVIGMSYN